MVPSSHELHYLTIAEAAPLIRDGRLSPVELTQAYLQRIGEIDGRLDSYVTLLPDRALEQARQAEAEIAAGNYRGPLHGIPIGLKDLYDTAGIRTTAMSRVTPDRIPHEDATTVAKLYDAAWCCWGSWRCMNSPWEAPISRACSRRRGIHGTLNTCQGAAAAGQA